MAGAGVGGEHAGPSGVGEDAHSTTGGKWPCSEHLGGVEELLDRIDPDHACLTEERIDGFLGAGESGSMRGSPTGSRGRPPALHGDDRLGAAQIPCDPAELVRITERLQVEQAHFRSRVLLPPAHQVVAAYVPFVPRRDEARETETARSHLAQQRDPEAPGLGDETERSGERPGWSEGRVHRDGRISVHDAEAVGTNSRIP